MSIRSYFRKFKIRAKTFFFVITLTILEVILLLSGNDWRFSIIQLLPFVQLGLIFEKRDMWNKLSDKDKEKILLTEDDITGLVRGIEKLIKNGLDSKDILKKIKED